MQFHQELEDVIEDQLSLGKTTNTVLDKHNDGDDDDIATNLFNDWSFSASIHYLRSHYQEAIDIYKRILLDNRFSKSFMINAKFLFDGRKF